VTHLRRYLEQTGALPPEHLDAAVRRQQIYGGSLDTVLLELELMDAHTLGELLVQACGLPLAPFGLIDDERDRPWHALPGDVLDIGWAVPLVMRGNEIWIAVHPDLPNERLGALYRMVPGVNPFVIPECALEKIAAERTASVVPQRYAVLCVAYLSAMRRRPSVSDVGFPLLSDATSASMQLDVPPPSRRGTLAPDDDLTPMPVDPDSSSFVIEDDFERRPTMVYEPAPDGAAVAPAAPPLVLELDVPGEGHLTLRVETGAQGPKPAVTAPKLGRATLIATAGPAVLNGAAPLAEPADEPQARDDAAPSATHDPHAAPIVLTTTTIVGGPPPVRFTARGTMISSPRETAAPRGPAEVATRMAATRAALAAATTRDAVVAALAEALTVLSTRTALMRVRNRELVGIATPSTKLPDPAGRVVPIGASGLLATAQADGRYVGFVDDEVFARAFELEMYTPCLVRRIDVAGRPTLVAYVDRGGDAFAASEPSLLDEICALAGRALETVVKLRRADSPTPDETGVRTSPLATSGPSTPAEPAGIGAPPAFGTTPPTNPVARPIESPWRPPTPVVPLDLIETDGPQPPPPRTRTMVDGSPRRPVAQAPDDPPRSRPTAALESPALASPALASPALESLALESLEAMGGAMRGADRITENYTGDAGDAPAPTTAGAAAGSRQGQMLTIHAMPPPPPLPPPPPMAADSVSHPIDTLMGLPPPVSTPDARPRFVPPPLDDHENSGIIPLSSPIDQPSMRGRIELDDEDWSHPGRQLPSESMQRRVDAALRGIATGGGTVAELRSMGEPALLRLAAQFPGALEVLRRDLRALPPPSAHGPLIRTAILLGGDFVPHLVDLFDHPSPDVRFYAAFVFQELRDSRAMRPLSELAFDTSGDVRVISMRVLETYSRQPGFGDAVRVVRAQLDSTNRTRQLYAARAVGTLRDIAAIPRLVDMLSSRDRFVQEAALESLCSITGQQLGLKPHRWKTWYAENEHRHRIEWIIESLRHRDVPVRRWAADELTRVTGHREPFSAMGDKRTRDIAVEAWTEWWQQRGRAQLGGD
jgi:hypothetical protein